MQKHLKYTLKSENVSDGKDCGSFCRSKSDVWPINPAAEWVLGHSRALHARWLRH